MAKKHRTLLPDLAAGLRRVTRWRESRARPGPMPEGLWSEVVALARIHGVNPVARALRLDYYSLKRRLDGSPKRSCLFGSRVGSKFDRPSSGLAGRAAAAPGAACGAGDPRR